MATNFAPTCSLSPPKLYSFNFFPNTAQGCFQEVALLDMQRLGSFTALLVLLVFLAFILFCFRRVIILPLLVIGLFYANKIYSITINK